MLDKQILDDLGLVSRGMIFPSLLVGMLSLLVLLFFMFSSVIFRYLGWFGWMIDQEYYFLCISVMVGSGLIACSVLNAHIIIDFATENLSSTLKDSLDCIGCILLGCAEVVMGVELWKSGIERHYAYDVTENLYWSVLVLMAPFATLLVVSGVYAVWAGGVSAYKLVLGVDYDKKYKNIRPYDFWSGS